MTWEHDRVEELLAGHALGALTGEDADLAERAIIEHVPECERCRETLDTFREIAADLALLAPAVAPPETLWARLRRTASRVPPGPRSRAVAAWVAGAAAVVALAALSGWNLTLSGRVSRAENLSRRVQATETRQAWLVDAISSLEHPESSVVRLEGSTQARVVMVYVHGEERTYLLASRLPQPDGVYQVWFGADGRTWSPLTFRPRSGAVMLPLEADPDEWALVMVTEEPEGGSPTPSASPIVSATVEPQ